MRVYDVVIMFLAGYGSYQLCKDIAAVIREVAHED